MGKNARIAELETRIDLLARALVRQNGFINHLCEVPDDAVLLYTMNGTRISCEIGKAARVLRNSFQQLEEVK